MINKALEKELTARNAQVVLDNLNDNAIGNSHLYDDINLLSFDKLNAFLADGGSFGTDGMPKEEACVTMESDSSP